MAGTPRPVLKSLHPLAKLVMCLIWLAASILIFDGRFQLAVIVLAAALLVVLDRRSPLFVLALMVPFALFGFGFLTTSILFRQDSDFSLRMAQESPFGGKAASAGVVLFLRAIASGMISSLFVLTTDPGQFLKALMRDWRMSPRVAHALFSALQILPDLAADAQQIRLARALKRGRPPTRLPSPREVASLVIPMLAFAIRRASRAAIAMEAKGLGAPGRRTVLGAPEFHRRDVLFLLSSAVCLAGLVLLG